MAANQKKSRDQEIDELIHFLPAWVMGGLAESCQEYFPIECLRSVSKVAADLKAQQILGEIERNAERVLIRYQDAKLGSVEISISPDGTITQKTTRD